eukprot:Gregarina_sp_Poly_1__810@NODE_1193_length_4817_cov_50_219579_g820_i0_p1_GENE_NODE_1193_length_4817_cov_50_219579_g820_i0NODE_1193_length_4817_cov_50_219579_g820_i0_p1_ORF_typecomplete_len1185_score233_49TPR_15/PF13429_6/1_7TPR_15/PF13429_6/1_9TPR_15/PF13429_6/1_2e03TPR_15/PF13429_6/3_9TPR_15/PF13429_6/9_2e02TPR_15/PF13429_6/3_7e03Coatomer_E/PF04733_14/0_039Coatomer_E/PF04733_14/67Coatomer_E/PF04733_14/6_3e03DUF4919/PF16266_5/0_14TPR_2/PF07719_17/2_4TPR_2/PF07719_17/1e02TPR_21/PF09976_9/1_5TPR_21
MKNRPANERVADFMAFVVGAALIAIQRLFLGDESGREEALAGAPLGRNEQEASRLIAKCEELLGGGGEISSLLCMGGGPNELVLLPFQTSFRRNNILKENCGLTEVGAKNLVNTCCLQVTALNGIYNLVLAYVHSVSGTTDVLEYMERASVMFEAVRSKKTHQAGVDLGIAALQSVQGEWNEVAEALQKDLRLKRKRSKPYQNAASEALAYALCMSGKMDKVAEDPVMASTDIHLLGRDASLKTWPGLQSLDVQQSDPGTVLLLADCLFAAGRVELSQDLVEYIAPYCLRPTKRRQVDPGLNKKFIQAEYFYQRGRLLHVMEEDETAAEEFRAALANNPVLHAARLELVRCSGAGSQLVTTQQNAAPLSRRYPLVCLNLYKELAMKAFLTSSSATSWNDQCEILSILNERPTIPQQESLVLKRLKLATLARLANAGAIESCVEAYEAARDLLQITAQEAPRRPRETEEETETNETKTNEADAASRETTSILTDDAVPTPGVSRDFDADAEEASVSGGIESREKVLEMEEGDLKARSVPDAHYVSICLKRKSVPIEYCVIFAFLQAAVGKQSEACQTLQQARAHLKYKPNLNAVLLEQVTLAHLEALFTAGKYAELHSRIKRVSADKNSRLGKRKEFTVLRTLSYIARGDLKFARALAERMLSVLYAELISSGGRDSEIWEFYVQAVELAFLSRSGVSTDPFHDKTKELVERCLKKESQRLSDDPSAAAMPSSIKSRLLTVSAWLSLERGLRRRHHEKRIEQEKRRPEDKKKPPVSNSTKYFTEARDCARNAFRLDPFNWRACYLIGRGCRELHQAVAAAKIYRVMADSLSQTIHPSQRPLMELALMREGTLSMAAARKPHATHLTKLHKSLSAVLNFLPDDVMFLVDIADIIVDGSLAGIVVPFFADMLSKIGEPSLLVQNAFASLRTKELLSKAKHLDSEKDLETLTQAIEEAQLIAEMYEKLMREKLAAKRLQMERRQNGDVEELPQRLSFSQLKARDFPICGSRLARTDTTESLKLTACPSPSPLRELERLPKDESLRRLLDKQILPLLRRLKDAEAMVAERLKFQLRGS